MQAVPGFFERVLFSRLSKNACFRSAHCFQNFRGTTNLWRLWVLHFRSISHLDSPNSPQRLNVQCQAGRSLGDRALDHQFPLGSSDRPNSSHRKTEWWGSILWSPGCSSDHWNSCQTLTPDLEEEQKSVIF